MEEPEDCWKDRAQRPPTLHVYSPAEEKNRLSAGSLLLDSRSSFSAASSERSALSFKIQLTLTGLISLCCEGALRTAAFDVRAARFPQHALSF